MSADAHEENETHGNHGQDNHGGHGEHGHEPHWGDYNAQPPPASTLPPISGPALAVFGFALAAMLGAITLYSLKLSNAQPVAHGHTEHESKSGE